MSPSIFFIAGCPRSGTTVLQQALNRHRSAIVPAESKYFVYFWGMPLRWQKRHQERMGNDLRIDLPPIRSLVRGDECHRNNFVSIAHKVIKASGKQVVTHFGEKTPEHANRIPAIRSVFPDCKVVYVLRDPRAVVASLLTVPWIRCSPLTATMIWLKYTKYWHELQRSPDPNAIVVRYEDLAESPEAVLSEICEFLGLSFETDVASGSGCPDTIPAREMPWKSRSLMEISPSRMDIWRKVLGIQELGVIERLAGNAMEEMGYHPVTPAPFRPSLLDSVRLPIECLKTASSLTWQCAESEARYAVARLMMPLARRKHPAAKLENDCASVDRLCTCTAERT
ncbi:sulfotransferase family protein [Roseiconus lacunae]|uniref:sulfotransferase family protein n=1 Tax=Roseiconus lacunae TaxID=2605694 RepID=UPI003F5346B4